MPLDRQQAAQLKSFGVNVRRERQRRAMTQEKLAELAELNPRTIQKIEAGKVNLLITTVCRIQKVLRCSWDRLL